MTNEKAFDLTPNYGVIFKQFIKDAGNAGEDLDAALYRAAGPDNRNFTAKDFARRAAILRAVQSYLAPVTIALQVAASVTEVEQVRTVMADTLNHVDGWAAEFESHAEPQEDK